MPLAPIRYPKLLHHLRWCRNGSFPDAYFINQAVGALNHATAYRRKTFFSVGGALGSFGSDGASDASVTHWRAHLKTGHGATEIRFKVGLGLVITSDELGTDPRVEFDVTVSGGATTTETVRYGHAEADSMEDDAPFTIHWTDVRVAVSANTAYEIAIHGKDGGRPLAVCCYEYASPLVDESVNYYAERFPGVEQPIYDIVRQRVLQGLSETWLAGGAPLIYWPGRGDADGSAVSITGTTWTNAIDGSSTSVTSATPGYLIGAEGAGDTACTSLLPLCRIKDGDDLPVTLAVYGNTSAGSTGEVRLVDSGGTVACSKTGITTTLQWHTTDTTIANVESFASNKLDLQLRNGTAGQTTNVYAVSLYCRGA